MGKHANERAHREWQRQQDRDQDEYFEPERPLSDDELAEIANDRHWRRVDAAPHNSCRVHLWDDTK
jgi:hypothetical protein